MTGFLMIAMVLLFVLGAWALVRILGNRSAPTDRLEAYLQNLNAVETERPEVKKSLLQALGQSLEKTPISTRLLKNIRKELVQADVPLTAEEFSIIRGAFSMALGFLAFAISRQALVALLLFGMVWGGPRLYLRMKKAQRIKQFTDQLGDALTLLANSLRAGFSFLQAVNSVAKEMPDPIGKEFGRLMKEMSLGMTMEDTLAKLLERIPCDDLELLITAILIQKEIGGNLAEILDNISGTIRERVRIKNEIRTLTAQGRLSGIVVVLIPILLGIFLFTINPKYIMLLFTEPVGQIMLGVGAFNEVIGIILIQKIVNIEV